MCNVYDFKEPITGLSGREYFDIAGLKAAEDIFGREALLKNNTWEEYQQENPDVLMGTSSFEEQIDSNYCLCYLETQKLLEQRGLKYGIDFKLDWDDCLTCFFF